MLMRALAFSLAVLMAAQPAHAVTIMYEEYAASPNTEVHAGFIEGSVDAFGWANSMNETNGVPLLYCQPRDMGLRAGEAAAILDAFMSGATAEMKQYPVGLLLLFALQQRFPC